MSIFISILTMLIMLSILTIVHEWGHFIAARIFKVTVTEFSIFMGPKIWSRKSKKTGTTFSIRALPLGGFCAFEDDQGNTESPNSLNAQKWYKRLIIFVAGVFLNIVLALIITIIVLTCTGYQTTEIKNVSSNTPAAMISIEPGDKLTEVNGHSILTTTDYNLYSYVIRDQNEKPDVRDSKYTLTYEKDSGKEIEYTLKKHAEYQMGKNEDGEDVIEKILNYSYTIEGNGEIHIFKADVNGFIEEDDDTKAICTVTKTSNGTSVTEENVVLNANEFNSFGGTNFCYVKTYNPFKIIGNSAIQLVSMVKSIYLSLAWLITGTVGLDAVSGPVGLTSLVDTVVSETSIDIWSKVLTMLNMTALISVNLGVFNLLPIPGLDGFHVVFIIIELIRRGKKVPPEKQAIISNIGLILLILLAVVIMFSDIFKLVN